ncbi:hypothetical protein AGMMS50239_27640 [Bacteroidia bacterium]|nr:hypothetical protein AGMMS50239_27640 [Bacteroidia bacterium]
MNKKVISFAFFLFFFIFVEYRKKENVDKQFLIDQKSSLEQRIKEMYTTRIEKLELLLPNLIK